MLIRNLLSAYSESPKCLFGICQMLIRNLPPCLIYHRAFLIFILFNNMKRRTASPKPYSLPLQPHTDVCFVLSLGPVLACLERFLSPDEVLSMALVSNVFLRFFFFTFKEIKPCTTCDENQFGRRLTKFFDCECNWCFDCLKDAKPVNFGSEIFYPMDFLSGSCLQCLCNYSLTLLSHSFII